MTTGPQVDRLLNVRPRAQDWAPPRYSAVEQVREPYIFIKVNPVRMNTLQLSATHISAMLVKEATGLTPCRIPVMKFQSRSHETTWVRDA